MKLSQAKNITTDQLCSFLHSGIGSVLHCTAGKCTWYEAVEELQLRGFFDPSKLEAECQK